MTLALLWKRTLSCCWRSWVGVLAITLPVVIVTPASGQSSATLVGDIVDTTGAALRRVSIVVVNADTSATRGTTSGEDGDFVLPTLPPGRYVLRATLSGFRPTELRDIVLNVNDRVAVRIEMAVASVDEGVVVLADVGYVRTSPAVSTVIDRQFVENLPLNGRSFQSLLELTPGVTIVPDGGRLGGGQFTVNGQRSNANYFTVDGVSANAAISSFSGSFPGQGASGQLPAMNVLGGTNSMVAADALQEFRIHTSSYAAEFGRAPGGQVSMVTRSGTNAFHGSISEYFRDDALDATDWFTNNRGLPRPELSQHTFGGVIGGPILKNRLFFFGSYEGLRLLQPRTLIVTVPSVDVRQSVPRELRDMVNAMPLPNGRERGNGLAEFSASWSDPSRFDASSVRVDHAATDTVRLFGRVSHAPSYTKARTVSLNTVSTTHVDSDSTTVGATWISSRRTVADVRLGYATNHAPVVSEPDSFGGALPLPPDVFHYGRSPGNALVTVGFQESPTVVWGTGSDYLQRQFNLVSTVTLTSASHEWKFGADYRRTHPRVSGTLAGTESYILSIPTALQGRAVLYNVFANGGDQAVAFDNLSIFAQDNWKPTAKLTLNYGVRWEFVPPPHATEGLNAATLLNIEDPYGGRVRLAPKDTPLWKTRYAEFAPRIGASYRLSERATGLVIRSGLGIFFDTGLGNVANAFGMTYPNVANASVSLPQLPLSQEVLVEPSVTGLDPPGVLWLMDPRLRQPYTIQWNVSTEQSLGNNQSLTVGYVGASGHKLLKYTLHQITLLDWPDRRTAVQMNRNAGYSAYNSLQVRFQRRLSNGLQSLVSYTLGQSRDTASSDSVSSLPLERVSIATDYGYSDFDVRHVLTAGVTWQITEAAGTAWLKRALSNWGVDAMMRFRSGFPINVVTSVPFPPETQSARPNIVLGEPVWLEDSSAPGGKRLNRSAFATPPSNSQGDLPRGTIRGFTAKQVDLAVRRDVRLLTGVRLQLRWEVYNVFNTPNFSNPVGFLLSGSFGLSTQTLSRGLGGLTPLYQIGGARSTQLAVKLLF